MIGQIGRDNCFRPGIVTESFHSATNDNDLRVAIFVAARIMTISSTYFADEVSMFLETKTTDSSESDKRKECRQEPFPCGRYPTEQGTEQ